MTSHRVRAIPSVLVLAFVAGCSDFARQPLGPSPPGATAAAGLAAKPVPPNLVADVTLHSGLPYQSAPLVSTCPATVGTGYPVQFGHSACLVFTPTGSAYALTDDVLIAPGGLNKYGVIKWVTVTGQDIIGPDGIKHETDQIQVSQPIAPNTAGFTLHVHADNVPVYRLSGHTGGKRVAMIGTISVWDIVYRTP